jgi:hypothetical protein
VAGSFLRSAWVVLCIPHYQHVASLYFPTCKFIFTTPTPSADSPATLSLQIYWNHSAAFLLKCAAKNIGTPYWKAL